MKLERPTMEIRQGEKSIQQLLASKKLPPHIESV